MKNIFGFYLVLYFSNKHPDADSNIIISENKNLAAKYAKTDETFDKHFCQTVS